MRVKYIYFLFIIFSVFLFNGCYGIFNDPLLNTEKKEKDYIIEFAMNPSSYTSYIDKELEPVTNQLTSIILNAKNVSSGFYPASDALENSDYSLNIIRECIDGIDVMRPPVEYEENRENVLRLLKNVENSIITYQDILKTEPVDTSSLESIIEILKADFFALTSEFNVYWE